MRVNTIRLRVVLGILGMLLPWIVVLLQLFNETFTWPDSISATWYTNACTSFMIILGASSILLGCYKGYDWQDDLVLTLSGIAGMGICLFPCWHGKADDLVGTFLLPSSTSNTIHVVFAVVFFALLSYNSLFLFTKGDKVKTRNKKIRNIIFRICGIGMVASFALFLIPYFPCQTWLVETIALSFFGISFLTKANIFKILFCDPKDQK